MKVFLLDTSGEKEIETFSLDGVEYTDIKIKRLFLTDDGKLILGGKIADLRTGTITELFGGDDLIRIRNFQSISCKAAADRSVLTAAGDWDNMKAAYCITLYRDGEWEDTVSVPFTDLSSYDLSRCSCDAIGPLGYVVVSAQENSRDPARRTIFCSEERRWLDASFLDPMNDEVLAMGEEHPWLAVQTHEGALNIYDLTALEEVPEDAAFFADAGEDSAASKEASAGASGEGSGPAAGDADVSGSESVQPLLSFENAVPGQSVVKLLFFRQDTRLAAFSTGGDLLIYDTTDGSLVQSTSFSREMLWFDTDSRYEVREAPENGKVLFLFDSSTYADPVCITADRDTLETTGLHFGVTLWIPSNNRIYVTPYLNGMLSGTLLTTEEIQQRGEQLLEEGM